MFSYRLNETGMHYIKSFVAEKGKDGLNAEAYFSDAEGAANDAFDRGLQATLEIGHFMSYDKRTHVLTLDQAWFDAQEIEE